jgi:hypothetical protein
LETISKIDLGAGVEACVRLWLFLEAGIKTNLEAGVEACVELWLI